ncbi:hypothetical protein DFR70_104152 [Nocardia tenerifensis]|uniref:Uncharacterized protein n=1 Tax=Nocardia tenerifensis TaxID=228006 RepID=A0A318K1F2_9NOCA|nr:hypothetical protein DFR70_104152 [Nocardia tenerifensis]
MPSPPGLFSGEGSTPLEGAIGVHVGNLIPLANHKVAQWNWPSSVEPFSAAVEVFGSTVVAMVSK